MNRIRKGFRRKPWTLAVVMFAVAAAHTPAGAQNAVKKVLSVDDYSRWKSINGSSISGDGKWVTYVVSATNTAPADAKPMLHLLRLDLSFHHAHTPGELIERLDGDVTALANFFSRFVVYVAGNVVLLAGVVLLLGREDALIGLETAVFAVAILVI